MPQFDIEAARKEGYTDAEIAEYLAQQADFDIEAARAEGYADDDIIGHLSGLPPAEATAGEPVEVPITPPPAPDNSLGQWAGVATDALAPYATAAALGAGAGAPAGAIGALPGAALGVAGLGLGDLGTAFIYNPVLNAFGYKSVPLPSDTIRDVFREGGLSRAPQTSGQQVFGAALEGAAGGFGGAAGANALARTATSPVPRRVFNAMAEAPRVQAASGAGAAAAGQAASSDGFGMGGQIAASLIGGLAGGRIAAPRPAAVTGEALKQQAKTAYDAAENSGVAFSPDGMDALAASTQRALTGQPNVQFHKNLHPRIATVLAEIENAAAKSRKTGQPVSFAELELLRRLAGTAGKSVDADERRLGHVVKEQIDNFVQAPPANAVAGGDAPGAAAAIGSARSAWRKMAQAEQLQTLIDRAGNMVGAGDAASLRSQFRTVANNPARMRRFDPEIQTMIKDIAAGRGGVAPLQNLGRLSPSVNFQNIARAMTAEGATAMAGHPEFGLYALGAGAVGAGAQTTANRLAARQASKAVKKARGTPDFKMPVTATALGTANALAAPNRQVFLGYGTGPSGEQYPMYGEPSQNQNALAGQ